MVTVRHNAMIRKQARTFAAAALCGTALLAGCMQMQTQRATLEHKPNIVRAEGAGGADGAGQTPVVSVPEERGGPGFGGR